jgi:glycosyltransferase involved in cell wall biosynthesis
MERKVHQSSRFRNAKVVTIPNPISEDFLLDISKNESRHKLGLSDNSIVFVLIANNLSDPAKNVKLAVEAFGSLRSSSREPQAYLYLVGLGGEKFENQELGIRWTGPLNPSNLAETAAAADWVLSTSFAESAGMTIPECASLGVPSIVMDAGGVSEMLVPKETGLVAKTDKEFTGFLELAMGNELSQSELSGAARVFARERFNPKTIAQKYLELYQS